MSRVAVILMAAVSAWVPISSAQIVAPAGTAKPSAPVAAAPTAPTPTIAPRESKSQRIPLTVLDYLKKTFDSKLQGQDLNDPIDLLGLTQGVYLSGYGAVFTTELSPIVTPGLSPFHTKITDQERAQVHQRKAARIPVLERLMAAMMADSAKSLNLMPDDQMVVVAVRLLYLPWEDTNGLPNLIMMKADRRTVLMGGAIQTEEQK